MAFTFFFRDSHTLEQVIKYFLPTVEGLSKINIWDAGCAMGPEPYTFAIMLAERMGYFAFKRVKIDASDLDENNTFGKIINDGIYHIDDLKRIPEDIFHKYFKKTDTENMYIIDDNIRSRVVFHKHDLLTLQPFSDSYNLIFCKNVLLHFQPAQRVEVIDMFHKSLSPNGIFATEQTQAMPQENLKRFSLLATDANVYQKIG
jgi:chemotaxis protein methyltransferase CheR